MIVLHPVHGYRIRPQEDLKTIKRNARERNRVQTVNQGFEKLRLHIPGAACDKKMSKVNILSHAVSYIQCLHAMIQQQQQHVLNNSNNGLLPQSPGVSSSSDYFSSPDASFGTATTAAATQLSTFSADFTPMRPTQPLFSHHNGFSGLPTPGSGGSCYSSSSPHTPFTPHSPFTPRDSGSSTHTSYQQQHSHFNFPAAGSPHLQHHQLFGPHEATPHVPAPEEDSEGEDDLLDAIVEWQDHAAADIS